MHACTTAVLWMRRCMCAQRGTRTHEERRRRFEERRVAHELVQPVEALLREWQCDGVRSTARHGTARHGVHGMTGVRLMPRCRL